MSNPTDTLSDRLKALASQIDDVFERGDSDPDRETLTQAIAAVEERDALLKLGRALKFSAYPAHGSGFICQVTGPVDEFIAALTQGRTKP